ncbi:SAM-dependent methyltransferases [Zymobacter palmae]|uniref:SAM-dependent methyltransferases n=1 Tax=Zymobacter palmae TaxID=33074 RepID=A0A348HBW4_9GAMM|nr:SAM-dependent methyltransferases [Zymobacter palmae]
MLVTVTYTFAFIRLRRTEGTNFSRHLAETLLVSAFQHDRGVLRSFRSNTFRQCILDRVRETQREVDGFATCLCTVTDTGDFQCTSEPFGYTDDHVVSKRTGGTSHSPVFCRFARCEGQFAFFLAHDNVGMDGQLKLTLAAFDSQNLVVELGFDAAWQRYRVFCDPGHFSLLEYGADDFTADASLTCSAVGHYALGGGNDRHTQTICNLGKFILALVDAQRRLGYALQVFDDRFAFEILKGHIQLRLLVTFDSEVRNVTFFFQYARYLDLDLRRRNRNRRLGSLLRIANTRKHIRQSVLHAHLSHSCVRGYQLALVKPGMSPRIAASRSLLRPRPNLL